MKSKILHRLILYFVTSFIVFALIIGIVFSVLFSQHNTDVYKAELEKRAVNIASILSGFFAGGGQTNTMTGHSGMTSHGMGMMSGYGAFLRFTEDIAMSDVWIVDRDLAQITFGHGHMGLTFEDLPEGAEKVILETFGGKTSFSESFSEYLDAPSLSVAAPITVDGHVTGAVLLHSQISDIRETTGGGLVILIVSMIAAVILSVFVAIALSSRFTKPLGKMKDAALRISGGDYSVTTGVKQSDEIGELAAVMDIMAGKLAAVSQESANLEKLRQDFTANISHELRTPVTVIRGSLEALCEGVVTGRDKVSEYHHQMLEECMYLDRLVSDLLDLARLQNPGFVIEKQVIDLKGVATDAMRAMTRIAEPKGVKLIFDCAHECCLTIGDDGRLRQMLVIILDNAIKFSSAGMRVYTILSQDEDTLKLTIKDEGAGILPGDMPYLFERFYKQRSEQNKTGTGLGLAIAKQIADRHGASVEVTSAQNEGAAFCFTFQATQVSQK